MKRISVTILAFFISILACSVIALTSYAGQAGSASVRPDASTSSAERQSLDNLASKQACPESIEGIEGHNKNTFRIMLDPIGNSLPFAHALQAHIEQAVPGTRVILTRTGNETMRPLQHANFANRLEVDLFLSLRCYEDSSTRPQLAIYTFSYGDYAPSRIQDLAFYTYDQAYLLASGATQKYAHAMEDTFKKYAKQFDLIGSFSLPYKPLIGVTAPAIGIEIGLKNKQSWQSFVAPLCEAVAEILSPRSS